MPARPARPARPASAAIVGAAGAAGAGEAGGAREARELGPRARRTRGKLLDAAEALLGETSVRDISVVDIARRAGTSPATFYQYFSDVSEATLALAQRAAAELPALGELVAGPWEGEEGFDRARRLVEAFVAHWDAHRAVLLVRNLAADEGDVRFIEVRGRATRPVMKGLVAQIEAAQKAGRVDRALVPRAAAAALAAILERLAAYHRELELAGVSRADLVETCARIVVQTVRGEAR